MRRVLDLGSHDGFVGSWLRERFDGDLVLDGMELHPGACEIARGRGYRTVVQAPAEDAPQHFEPGSYDAVVLYELIEHVPDVDALLAAAEAMLKPGGHIYVSTPTGTFGAGHNPHHLRAYRPIDLADVLRRRGSVVDLEPGSDGVTAAAYTPRERRGDVAIYTGPSWMPWAPHHIETEGLGGSETAAVRVAEGLSDLGYVVTVYGEVDEGCVHDVLFRHHHTFDPAERRAAVICSRFPELAERPLAAQVRLLWSHDTDFGERLTQRFADAFDRVLTLSEWHQRHVEGLYPFLRRGGEDVPSKVVRTRNGVHLDYFAGEQLDRRPRVLYTSSPDRGLDVVLEEWPKIRERAPEAELLFAYAPVYYRIAEQDPSVGAHAAKIRELANQDGVSALGSVSQPELARLMCSSLVWVHPSWATPHEMPFHETSCIGAMEAQAAGLHVVASGWGALPETVRVGRLLGGDAPGEDWRAALVDHVVEGLLDEQVQRFAQAEGPKAAATLSWQGVAHQIAGLIEGEVVSSAVD